MNHDTRFRFRGSQRALSIDSKREETQFHLDSAIRQFNQKIYDELVKNENGNIIFSPFRSDLVRT